MVALPAVAPRKVSILVENDMLGYWSECRNRLVFLSQEIEM